jgi:hypothetical protein
VARSEPPARHQLSVRRRAVILIAFLLSQGIQIVLGQYASSVVRDALDSEIATTEITARLLVRTLRAVAAGEPAASIPQLAAIRQQTPAVRLIIATGSGMFTLPDGRACARLPAP